MEWAVGILTTLIGIAGTPGIVIDRVATDFVHAQIHSADVLAVRIENTPNYRILRGDVDRILVAGRGVYIQPFLRVDTIDLETDPISVNTGLGSQDFALRMPLQAAVRVIITSADVNLALQSPDIIGSFQGVEVNFSNDPNQAEIFDLINPRVDFLDRDRIRLTAVLEATQTSSSDRLTDKQMQEPEDLDSLEVLIEASLRVDNGVRLQIIDPAVNLQGVAVPQNITDAFVDGLNKILDLRQLEETGIIARVLQFKVTDGQMQVVGFAQLQPEALK
jgi:hypothetical protein